MAHALEVEQAVVFQLGSKRVKVLEVQDVCLVESINRHAMLHARLRVEGDLTDDLSIIGSQVRMKAYDGVAYKTLFVGTVEEIEKYGSSLTISALGPTRARDEVVHTRTMGEGDRVTPVHRLPGISEVFANVKNASRLTRGVPLAWQYGITDFAFLQRTAHLHSLMLLTSARDNQVKLSDGSDGRRLSLPSDWIVPGSERIIARRRAVADAQCISWSAMQGTTPSKPMKPKPGSKSRGALSDFLDDASMNALMHSTLCRATIGTLTDDSEQADSFAQAQRGSLIRYQVQLSYPGRNIGVGARVQLKNRLPEELLVVHRKLRYCPSAGRPELQLTNDIECTPVDCPPLETYASHVPILIPLVGRVVDLDDPLQLARVKTRFPWHESGGRAGIWGSMPQPFGGSGEDRHVGAVNLPNVGDWVVALADPTGFEPPIILGSIYPGSSGSGTKKRPAPPSPTRERTLLRTASGAELRVVEGRDGTPMSLLLAIAEAGGKAQCAIRLNADGKIELLGEDLLFRGKSLLIESPSRIKGSLNVTKE